MKRILISGFFGGLSLFLTMGMIFSSNDFPANSENVFATLTMLIIGVACYSFGKKAYKEQIILNFLDNQKKFNTPVPVIEKQENHAQDEIRNRVLNLEKDHHKESIQEEQIQEKIRIQVLALEEERYKEKQKLEKEKANLDVLEGMTSISRDEIDNIAKEIRKSSN
jgi:hypothetical protein